MGEEIQVGRERGGERYMVVKGRWVDLFHILLNLRFMRNLSKWLG